MSIIQNLCSSPLPREHWITAPNPTEEMWDDFYELLCDIKLKEWEKRIF